jgi:hypothetical protein
MVVVVLVVLRYRVGVTVVARVVAGVAAVVAYWEIPMTVVQWSVLSIGRVHYRSCLILAAYDVATPSM